MLCNVIGLQRRYLIVSHNVINSWSYGAILSSDFTNVPSDPKWHHHVRRLHSCDEWPRVAPSCPATTFMWLLTPNGTSHTFSLASFCVLLSAKNQKLEIWWCTWWRMHQQFLLHTKWTISTYVRRGVKTSDCTSIVSESQLVGLKVKFSNAHPPTSH